MIKAIIFDMDGTLINSDSLVKKIYEDLILAFTPRKSLSDLSWNDIYAKSYHEVLTYLYGSVQPIHMDYINDMVEQHLEKVELFDGVRETLLSLKKNGYLLGLLTSELNHIAQQELMHCGILSLFDYTLAYDELQHGKPDPEGLLKHQTFFKIRAHEMLYVGDQIQDGKCAKNAHVESVLIRRDQQDEKDDYFNHVIRKIDHVLEILEKKARMTIKTQGQKLNILQLTDLHLMNQKTDDQTYQLIDTMIRQRTPDFVMLTGDQVMCDQGDKLYRDLTHFLDQYQIPYAYIFGNHDTDHQSYETLIHAFKHGKYLQFESGPQDLGYSNFVIEIMNEVQDVYHLFICLDSHRDQIYTINQQPVWGYGTISLDQMQWIKAIIERYKDIPHTLFLHIPPYEVSRVEHYQGSRFETPCTPPIDNGWLTDILSYGLTKGVFFGHDHYNDFSFKIGDTILAYGLVSGFYEYNGFNEKGARMITIDNQELTTYKIYKKDIIK